MAEERDRIPRGMVAEILRELFFDILTFVGLDWIAQRSRDAREGRKTEPIKLPGIILEICSWTDPKGPAGNIIFDDIRFSELTAWTKEIGSYRRSQLESMSRDDVKRILSIPDKDQRNTLLEDSLPPSPWAGLKKFLGKVEDTFLKGHMPKTEAMLKSLGQWARTRKEKIRSEREKTEARDDSFFSFSVERKALSFIQRKYLEIVEDAVTVFNWLKSHARRRS